MSDIRFDNAMNANADVDTEHADASASGSADGALHASENGASYDGSLAGDATYTTRAPELPELPEVPDTPSATGELTGAVDGAVGDASAHVDGAASAAGGLPELPDVPELPEVPEPHGSVGIEATLEAWADAMGELAANVSGALSAVLGF